MNFFKRAVFLIVGNIILSVNLLSQEFSTTIQFIDSSDNVDSIVIGYDPTASILLDPQFGEFNIIDSLYNDDLDVRIGQINVNNLDCFYNMFNSEVFTYLSKKDILPKGCLEWDSNQTINGIIPFSTILIKNSDLPITMKWDSTLFTSSCLYESFITDKNPGLWFDSGCPDENYQPTNLRSQDEMILSIPSGIEMIDSSQESYSLFFVALTSEISNSTINTTYGLKLFPNPFINNLYFSGTDITSKNFNFQIFDVNGYLVKSGIVNGNKLNLDQLESGLYFLKMRYSDEIFISRIVKL